MRIVTTYRSSGRTPSSLICEKTVDCSRSEVMMTAAERGPGARSAFARDFSTSTNSSAEKSTAGRTLMVSWIALTDGTSRHLAHEDARRVESPLAGARISGGHDGLVPGDVGPAIRGSSAYRPRPDRPRSPSVASAELGDDRRSDR